MKEADLRWLARARELAERGRGLVAPNPIVGCVLVREDQEVGAGWHEALGGPHAEINALSQAGPAAEGATVYVTLEPCCHEGRTPPCTRDLTAAKVGRVVCGSIDPNPKVSGRGIEVMRQAGIETLVVQDEGACLALNRPFWVYMREGRTHVTVKMAATLDGRSASANGCREQVTGPAAAKEVQRMRAVHQAVGVGIGTVLADDPALTVRDEGLRDRFPAPQRVVFDSRLRLPERAKLLQDDGVPVFVLCDESSLATAPPTLRHRTTLIGVPGGLKSNPRGALEALATHEICDLLLEGGASLVGGLEHHACVDAWRLHLAPRVLNQEGARGIAQGPGLGGMDTARALVWTRVEPLGDDVLLEAVRADLAFGLKETDH